MIPGLGFNGCLIQVCIFRSSRTVYIQCFYITEAPELTFLMIVVAMPVQVGLCVAGFAYAVAGGQGVNTMHRERQFGSPAYSGQLVRKIELCRAFISNGYCFTHAIRVAF